MRCTRPFRSTRRCYARSGTSGWAARSEAVRITSRIPAAAATRPFRSTPTTPKAVALRVSSHSASPRDRSRRHRSRRAPTFRTPSIYGAVEFFVMASAAPLFGEEALGRYDEMLDRTGEVRAHWKTLFASFASMAPGEYRHRLDSAMRMVRENGVTYNVYDEASGLGRPWQLDVAPFIVSPQDWTALEAAVTQRARLADAILRDIYGKQRLVRDGVVPAQLVLGHPQYLRALQG